MQKLTLPNEPGGTSQTEVWIEDGRLNIMGDEPLGKDYGYTLGHTSMWMIYQLLKNHFEK